MVKTVKAEDIALYLDALYEAVEDAEAEVRTRFEVRTYDADYDIPDETYTEDMYDFDLTSDEEVAEMIIDCLQVEDYILAKRYLSTAGHRDMVEKIVFDEIGDDLDLYTDFTYRVL